MDKIRKALKLTLGLCISAISMALITMPPLTIIGIPTLIAGLGMSYDGLMKKDLKHNIFKVSRKNNELIENPLRIDRFIKCILGKNKVKNFLSESMDCFNQLDVYENNKKVRYTMKSHGFTKKRLEELQSLGYIEKLESKVQSNGKKKSFFFENLAMGNFKNLFKKKEKFDISFELTGKSFKNEEINKYIDYVVNKHNKPVEKNNKPVENKKVFQTQQEDKSSNMEIDTRTKIVELKKIREELINSREESIDRSINMR